MSGDASLESSPVKPPVDPAMLLEFHPSWEEKNAKKKLIFEA
jgi:hypothetical protein